MQPKSQISVSMGTLEHFEQLKRTGCVRPRNCCLLLLWSSHRNRVGPFASTRQTELKSEQETTGPKRPSAKKPRHTHTSLEAPKGHEGKKSNKYTPPPCWNRCGHAAISAELRLASAAILEWGSTLNGRCDFAPGAHCHRLGARTSSPRSTGGMRRSSSRHRSGLSRTGGGEEGALFDPLSTGFFQLFQPFLLC